MHSTYLGSRRRPNPFLEISASTKDYIGSQLKEQASNENADKVEFDNIVTFWTTLTKVSDVIENGKRLENISWRLVNRKMLLKNELSNKDVSTVIEVAKGLECKELKVNSQKRKMNKRIPRLNIKSTSTNKEKNNPNQVPSLFNKKNLVSTNSNVSPKRHQNKSNNNNNNNKSKDNTNGRKTNFFFNISSPDSSSMSPPIRTQSSENIERVMKASNQSFSMLNNSSESDINSVPPPSRKINSEKLNEPVKPSHESTNTVKSHAHQILQSHNHTHQHGFGNNGAHHHNHSHLHHHYSPISHQQGQTQQPVLSNLNPQKRMVSERNGPPSLFKNTSQIHKNQSHSTILINGRSSSHPSLVKLNQTQIKNAMNKNTSQHNLNHHNKSSLFSFKPKVKQHVSASPDVKVEKIKPDNENAEEDDEDDDYSESDDDSSGWSSLSDEDEDFDDEDELHFEKQSVVPETKTRPVLKRSLLSGLFLDEIDKSDSSKDKDSLQPNRHANYDLHHKSNAPLTAQTLLPTALTTHIFLPTKNFTTFQNAQRHQYASQKTNGVPGSRSPLVPSQSQENMLQLTRDNVAKFTKDEAPNKNGYAASIHTTTSSIDIPGWEIKKMRELRRDERKIEKETEGDKLPVHLIDSLQNENRFFLDDNVDTGFVDDKIMKKPTLNYLETDDDFNYHAKGW